MVGIGVVARDHTRQCMAAMSKKLWVPLGPLEVEAKAMEEGIDFAWDVEIRDVVFEIDSKVLHRSLMGSITPPTTIQILSPHASCGLETSGPYSSHMFDEMEIS